MNEKLEEKLMDSPTLMGYKTLVKAIMNCDEEAINQINNEYNKLISGLD